MGSFISPAHRPTLRPLLWNRHYVDPPLCLFTMCGDMAFLWGVWVGQNIYIYTHATQGLLYQKPRKNSTVHFIKDWTMQFMNKTRDLKWETHNMENMWSLIKIKWFREGKEIKKEAWYQNRLCEYMKMSKIIKAKLRLYFQRYSGTYSKAGRIRWAVTTAGPPGLGTDEGELHFLYALLYIIFVLGVHITPN